MAKLTHENYKRSELEEVDFSQFLGMTFIDIQGMHDGSEEIVFTSEDGRTFLMYHEQDCCEGVYLESVTGDVEDLLNTPILDSAESRSSDTPPNFKHEFDPESQTWTFYKLRTSNGYVDLRWFGSSNGYYSERVDIREVIKS